MYLIYDNFIFLIYIDKPENSASWLTSQKFILCLCAQSLWLYSSLIMLI